MTPSTYMEAIAQFLSQSRSIPDEMSGEEQGLEISLVASFADSTSPVGQAALKDVLNFGRIDLDEHPGASAAAEIDVDSVLDAEDGRVRTGGGKSASTIALYIADKIQDNRSATDGGPNLSLAHAFLLPSREEVKVQVVRPTERLRGVEEISKAKALGEAPDLILKFTPLQVGKVEGWLVLDLTGIRIGSALSWMSTHSPIVRKVSGYVYSGKDEPALNPMAANYIPAALKEVFDQESKDVDIYMLDEARRIAMSRHEHRCLLSASNDGTPFDLSTKEVAPFDLDSPTIEKVMSFNNAEAERMGTAAEELKLLYSTISTLKYTDINGSPLGSGDDFAGMDMGVAGDAPARVRPLTFDKIETQLEPMRAMFIGRYREIWETLLKIEERQHIVDSRSCDMYEVTLTKIQRRDTTATFAIMEVPGMVEGRPVVNFGDVVRFRRQKPAEDHEDHGEDEEGGEGGAAGANGLLEHENQYLADKYYGHGLKFQELQGVVAGFGSKSTKSQVIVELGGGNDDLYFPVGDDFKWNVRFMHSEDVFVLMVAALARIPSIPSWLWPTKAPVGAAKGMRPMDFITSATWNYSSINDGQQAAVANFCSRAPVAGWPPYVLHGPPGTGKTITVIETVLQLIKRTDLGQQSKILLVAPSNAAADVLCQRLSTFGIASDVMHRFVWNKRRIETVPPGLLSFCHQDAKSGELAYLPLELLIKKRIVVATSLASGVLHDCGIPQGHFTHILVDEAGQALEPELFVPFSFAGAVTQLMLAGDPNQLGAVVRSRTAAKMGLGTSLQERLLVLPLYKEDQKRSSFDSASGGGGTASGGGGLSEALIPPCVSLLRNNYRSHSKILELSSKMFYNGILRPCADPRVVDSLCTWSELNQEEQFPIIMYGVEGTEMFEIGYTGATLSLYNPAEVTKVADVVQALLSAPGLNVSPADFGIIAPYRKQVSAIRSVLRNRQLGSVRVGCVNDYQGQEAKIIIVSTVLSGLHLEQGNESEESPHTFLTNPKRFNVVLSRAAALVVVVGNPMVLLEAPCWKELVRFCVLNDSYKGCAIVGDGVASRTAGIGDDAAALADLVATKQFLGPSDPWHPNQNNIAAWYNSEQEWRVDI